MSVYSTRDITRSEAIRQLNEVWKKPEELTNKELEEEMFAKFGAEWLEGSRLENYCVKDDEDIIEINGQKYKKL